MKQAYPIVLTPVKDDFEGFAVTVPDLRIYTQGSDIADAMDMARDAIGMWICYEQDEKDRKSTRLNSSHSDRSRMPSSA